MTKFTDRNISANSHKLFTYLLGNENRQNKLLGWNESYL